jgi:hypothetical protein
MSMRHVRLLCRASPPTEPFPHVQGVVPLMPDNMPQEARCQQDRGINAAKSSARIYSCPNLTRCASSTYGR